MQAMQQTDVVIVGGGIVGLAQAYAAAKRGRKVTLLERSRAAQGASVRNFGMIWPIGQPSGERYELALRSREIWLELAAHGVLNVEQCGSIHAAHHDDELAVLEEFRDLQTHPVELLTPAQVLEKLPQTAPDGLRGGMWSAAELRVDPRTASANISAWLVETHGVDIQFQTDVVDVQERTVVASDGRRWQAEQILVCSGSDLQTLFPAVFTTSNLTVCKLQMLKTVAQPNPPRMTPHLASGLTLRHYAAFEPCPTLPQLKNRFAACDPRLDQYGIHVMASFFPNGEVVLGDSHEYGAEISPFDKTEIDELILKHLRQIMRLDDWTIKDRWHGIYAKHPTSSVFAAEPADGVRIFVGPGGAGMTLSFGIADHAWEQAGASHG